MVMNMKEGHSEQLGIKQQPAQPGFGKDRGSIRFINEGQTKKSAVIKNSDTLGTLQT